MTDWNEIKNGKPKDNGKYIVCTEKDAIFFTRFYKHGDGGHFGVSKNVKITHWMPLPCPPKRR